MSGDKPIQLVDFQRKENNADAVLKLNNDAFQKLCSQAEQRPLCIICISGPSRQGKSFLLSYIVRYLEGMGNGNEDWIGRNEPSKALTGFKFRNGINAETQGIWIWN